MVLKGKILWVTQYTLGPMLQVTLVMMQRMLLAI